MNWRSLYSARLIERASELDEALLARGKAIEAAGYHQQVKVTSATTLLFEVKNGARTVVRRKINANGVNGGEFAVGEERDIVAKNCSAELSGAPEKFNPNVLFRPVVQDYLLPTLVYTGGAGRSRVLRASRRGLRKTAGTGDADPAAVFGDAGRSRSPSAF